MLLIHGPHRTQRIVRLTSLTDLSGKIQNKINQGKRHMWQFGRNQAPTTRVLPWWNPTTRAECLQQQVVTTHVKRLSARKAHGDSTPRMLIEYRSYKQSLSYTYPLPDFQEESRHAPWLILFAHSLGSVSPSSQFREWWGTSQIQVPRFACSQPCKEVFLIRAVSGLLC